PTASVRPLSEPIALSTVFVFRDPALADRRQTADPPEPNYGRDGLLNVRTLERAVAGLEGAEDAHATASGMAAIALVFLASLSAGDHVVVSADCYCDTTALLTHELGRFGVAASFVDAADPDAVRRALTPRTRLVYVETISNPAMKLADLPRLAEIAHDRNALLCVDNTFATPLLCRPLEHGADLVLHSATKYLGGHHDLTAGVVAGRRSLLDSIRRCGYRFGPTLGPMDAWLAVRGLHTLAPRIAWISETTATVAGFLRAHPAVAGVRYPGLPDHPQAELARRLLPDGAGGMLAFDPAGGADAADALIRRLRLIPYAPSLGGTTTTVCYPPRDVRGAHGGDRDGSYCCSTLRLSVGLEAAADLIADLEQALAGLPAAPPVASPAAGVPS
ncbi:MAG: aminotransferase class I/II-fold pyridoxal phosphate-dependent enzyme, partial [Chloroflexota bacterium]|nr:aminotransferase class I/II-fold pyridoxal phosphate-dependent enzyme [Chloroflexota bacterium]